MEVLSEYSFVEVFQWVGSAFLLFLALLAVVVSLVEPLESLVENQEAASDFQPLPEAANLAVALGQLPLVPLVDLILLALPLLFLGSLMAVTSILFQSSPLERLTVEVVSSLVVP